jgi:hypothetical protein
MAYIRRSASIAVLYHQQAIRIRIRIPSLLYFDKMLYGQFLLFIAAVGVPALVVERQEVSKAHILNYDCTSDDKGPMPGTS